jgi:hypothetical protein
MCIYGTDYEKEEIALIRKHLPDYQIVDPGSFQTNAEKSREGMRYCFRIIDGCHALIFSRLLGKVTAGVGLEVNYAISKPIPVYELQGGGIGQVSRPIRFLSREDTLKHYDFWRGITGRPAFR